MTYIPDALQQKAFAARTATRQCLNALLWLVFVCAVAVLPAVVIRAWEVLV